LVKREERFSGSVGSYCIFCVFDRIPMEIVLALDFFCLGGIYWEVLSFDFGLSDLRGPDSGRRVLSTRCVECGEK